MYQSQFFTTRVARRIFRLFILCVVLPIIILAAVVYFQVRSHLFEQGKMRLRQETKAISVSIYERLLLMRTEMKINAIRFNLPRSDESPPDGIEMGRDFGGRMEAMALITTGGTRSVLKEIETLPALNPAAREKLAGGQTLIRSVQNPSGRTDIIMLLQVEPGRTDGEILAAIPKAEHLWSAEARRPPGSEMVVIDARGQLLYTTFPKGSLPPIRNLEIMKHRHSGIQEWRQGGRVQVSSHVSLFLESNFDHPSWFIGLYQTREELLGAMSTFVFYFVACMFLALMILFFFAMYLVRKNLGPVETLKSATEKISAGKLGYQVSIHSGDEFESLGDSFNQMSRRLKESQNLLVRAARLSTMGQMAAGVMHEIKQPLTAIYGLLQVVQMDPGHEKSGQHLHSIVGAVERLNGILIKFSAFGRGSEEQMTRLSLDEVIGSIQRLFEHQIEMNRIRLEVDKPDHPVWIRGSIEGLQQVLSNLMINAMQALETRERDRWIRLRLRPDGAYLEMELADNGCGIPAAIRERIFDPFFSTKPPGEGNGLGMAITESILHKHDATITVQSEEGEGTRFVIRFPTAQ